ncbi:MAG: M48 family peptidase [Myxococcales bacterium]|nr:M48 family peptidase [Myxococcales bacterium]
MTFDFDFLRYVERRKGAKDAQAREGAAYAYAGDLKVLRTLEKLKPVKMALEGAVGLWRGTARAELLGPALKASEGKFPRVHAAGVRCAAQLHIAPPTIYITPAPIAGGTINAYTFGTSDDAAVLLHASLIDRLSDAELTDVVGRECGHLQNDHVLFRTALYFLLHSAGGFVRWIVKPAVVALSAWGRRAEITADRAGLLCSRDLDTSVGALMKVMLGPQLTDSARDELFGKHPEVARRAQALGLFAESAYYLGLSGAQGGLSGEECDAKVAKVMS